MINQYITWGLRHWSFPGGVQDSPQLRPGTVPRPGPSMRVTSIDPSAVAVAAIDEKADWEFCWQNFESTFHIQEGLDPNEVLITNLPNWVKWFLRNMPAGIKCFSHLTTCFGLRLANSVYSALEHPPSKWSFSSCVPGHHYARYFKVQDAIPTAHCHINPLFLLFDCIALHSPVKPVH